MATRRCEAPPRSISRNKKIQNEIFNSGQEKKTFVHVWSMNTLTKYDDRWMTGVPGIGLQNDPFHKNREFYVFFSKSQLPAS